MPPITSQTIVVVSLFLLIMLCLKLLLLSSSARFGGALNLRKKKQDIPLADKDDEKEEPSQHVAGIQNPEGYLDELAVLTGLIEMVVDKEVNSLNGPQNAKDQEQFQV